MALRNCRFVGSGEEVMSSKIQKFECRSRKDISDETFINGRFMLTSKLPMFIIAFL